MPETPIIPFSEKYVDKKIGRWWESKLIRVLYGLRRNQD